MMQALFQPQNTSQNRFRSSNCELLGRENRLEIKRLAGNLSWKNVFGSKSKHIPFSSIFKKCRDHVFIVCTIPIQNIVRKVFVSNLLLRYFHFMPGRDHGFVRIISKVMTDILPDPRDRSIPLHDVNHLSFKEDECFLKKCPRIITIKSWDVLEKWLPKPPYLADLRYSAAGRTGTFKDAHHFPPCPRISRL